VAQACRLNGVALDEFLEALPVGPQNTTAPTPDDHSAVAVVESL
jgi:hypothetical protein